MLIITGLSVSISNYHEAELKRINASENTQLFGYAYNRYAGKVNEQIDLYNKIIKEELSGEAKKQQIEKILAKESEIASLDRETQSLLVKANKDVELMIHYRFLRTMWFIFGTASLLVGIAASSVGFYKWLEKPEL